MPAPSFITAELYELVASLCRPGNVNLVFHVSLHCFKASESAVYAFCILHTDSLYSDCTIASTKLQFQ